MASYFLFSRNDQDDKRNLTSYNTFRKILAACRNELCLTKSKEEVRQIIMDKYFLYPLIFCKNNVYKSQYSNLIIPALEYFRQLVAFPREIPTRLIIDNCEALADYNIDDPGSSEVLLGDSPKMCSYLAIVDLGLKEAIEQKNVPVCFTRPICFKNSPLSEALRLSDKFKDKIEPLLFENNENE